jgi:hypothetical protein
MLIIMFIIKKKRLEMSLSSFLPLFFFKKKMKAIEYC